MAMEPTFGYTREVALKSAATASVVRQFHDTIRDAIIKAVREGKPSVTLILHSIKGMPMPFKEAMHTQIAALEQDGYIVILRSITPACPTSENEEAMSFDIIWGYTEAEFEKYHRCVKDEIFNEWPWDKDF